MKRILVSAALLLSLTGAAAFAQQDAPPQQGDRPMHHRRADPQREVAHLSKVLNLTPDQSSKLEPILANRDQQLQAVFQNQQLAPQDRREQMKTIHQTTEQQLATVLTPDQLQQMKAMRHDHRGHGQWGQQQPSAPPAA
jgi:Spy/CpxP family protein refolding chaperone